MVSERSLEVLRAIIGDYVATHEPVGSKRLVERYQFGVSAATIRNDMAALEEAELIAAPHTSSGRVPTDKGYRVFVDRLADVRPLTTAQRRAIEQFMEGSLEPEELLTRSVRTLAQLTGTVAIGHLPSLLDAHIHRIELVSLSVRRVLVVLITDTGRVEQRIVDLERDTGDEEFLALRDLVNERLVGKRLEDAAAELRELHDGDDLGGVADRVLQSLVQQVFANRDDKLIIAGAANLALTEHDFSSIFPVLEAIEEQVVLLRLVGELDLDERGVAVSIGHENLNSALEETSILATGYTPDGDARVGILGPTRMDYQRNIAAVRAVARYLSRSFDTPS
jgi:heat-inducible transcriptional repressor